MKSLAAEHPTVASAVTTQDRFGLQHAGDCGEGPCEVWVLHLGSTQALAPQVLVSGALHGDEQVGAVVCIALAEWLVGAHVRGEAWASHLLQTRGVVIVPTPNAVGYHEQQREERSSMGSIDPNRDFGFDQEPQAPHRGWDPVSLGSTPPGPAGGHHD